MMSAQPEDDPDAATFPLAAKMLCNRGRDCGFRIHRDTTSCSFNGTHTCTSFGKVNARIQLDTILARGFNETDFDYENYERAQAVLDSSRVLVSRLGRVVNVAYSFLRRLGPQSTRRQSSSGDIAERERQTRTWRIAGSWWIVRLGGECPPSPRSLGSPGVPGLEFKRKLLGVKARVSRRP